MSALPNAVYANPTTPCWTPAGGGGGGTGPTGPEGPTGPAGGGGSTGIFESIGLYAPDISNVLPFVTGGYSGSNAFIVENVKSLNGNGFLNPAYGSFSSTQTQTIGFAAPQGFDYDTQDTNPPIGMSCGFPSPTISVTDGGTYKVHTCIQATNIAPSGTDAVDVWLSASGFPVANSARTLSLTSSNAYTFACEWIVTLSPGDGIEVVGFAPGSSNLQAFAVPASSPVPVIPSIITTVLRIA